MKKCIRCDEFKSIDEFKPVAVNGSLYKQNGELRTTKVCKECRAKDKIDVYRGYYTLPRRIYKDQIHSSKSRGHTLPKYTEEELVQWITSQPNYNELYITWVNSNYDKDKRPSVDRLNDTKGYSFDNIRLITWKENNSKEHQAHKVGKSLNDDLKETWQYSIDGVFVAKYISQAEAARQVKGADQRNISAVCRGKLRCAYGYQWFFEEQTEVSILNLEGVYLRPVYSYCAFTGNKLKTYTNIDKLLHIATVPFYARKMVIEESASTGILYSFNMYTKEQVLEKVKGKNIKRPVRQYTTEGKFIKEFPSAYQAYKQVGTNDTTIGKCCKLKKPDKKGFQWRYTYDDELAYK